MRAFFRLATDPWETVTAEAEEMLEAPDGRILVLDRWRFRGRGGIEIVSELANLYAFRDGLIVRIDGYTDRAEGRAAVGLDG
jgi:ketosteroid isomerase-like protein